MDIQVKHRRSVDEEKLETASKPAVVEFSAFWQEIQLFGFLFVNVGAWYFANGMNGIAMQNLNASLKSEPHQFGLLFFAINFVTTLQLLVGSALGVVLLNFLNASNLKDKAFLSKSSFQTLLLHPTRNELLLTVLHTGGSMSTNLGFMFGSASLVQIIKLLEPFETLLWTKLLIPDVGKSLTFGILSSMTLTVCAAMSLIQSHSEGPHPYALFFSVCSGLFLSCRNVLQRKLHTSTNQEPLLSMTEGRADLSSSDISKLKLEKSLMQFAIMSWQSGLLLLIMLPISFVAVPNKDMGEVIKQASCVSYFTWHPLYNAFSMITLGFCTALTHSLLNVGKRVSSIAMAIIWFGESVSLPSVLGLTLVLVGGGLVHFRI